ncbi:DUF1679 domain-containing protein [Salinimonas sp. HHU 13199]|uniref:DUF1679 domain-containing protein n=1 Tax=Salinimonas profundi TaxID=2729140 RepID=A0ABR8LIJ6_9ALTE|nr:oxidoreductase family protein [Salinimonas profundi]MBD3584786.1 DUF1679 domain-containing protein [Salinimonas profundi]
MNETVDQVFKAWVSEQLDDPDVHAFSLLQRLWSGYGQCFRFFSPKYNCSLVAKAVKPPDILSHPKGWNNNDSHQRKLTSYQIERTFYSQFRARLMLPAPELITEDKRGDAMLLIMTDLDSQGFDQRYETLNIDQASLVLRYLAGFHATFLFSREDIVTQAQGLWPRGTYWHLDTRQHEFSAMADGFLKHSAHRIDRALANCPYQTVVHGDAKVANFCFTADAKQTCNIAAVDFQYPGAGIGVQDVAYFIGSALSEDDQAEATGTCLDVYFEALRNAMPLSSSASRFHPEEVEQSWRALYPIACADFQRFLEGWSPGHWKLNTTLNHYTQKALSSF